MAKSQIILSNNTKYVAQFIVKKGDQVIARIPGIDPGALCKIPTEDTYQVSATTILNNNEYTTTPANAAPGDSFLAQVLQISNQGTYDFEMVKGSGSEPLSMQFQSTTNTPVIFNVSKDGKPLQSVTVKDNFDSASLYVGNTFYIYSVIEGVTTSTITTNDGNAHISAENNSSTLEADFFHIALN